MSRVNSLSIEAMKTLLLEIPAETMQGRRHLAILSLLYESGARVQELIDLTPLTCRWNRPHM